MHSPVSNRINKVILDCSITMHSSVSNRIYKDILDHSITYA